VNAELDKNSNPILSLEDDGGDDDEFMESEDIFVVDNDMEFDEDRDKTLMIFNLKWEDIIP